MYNKLLGLLFFVSNFIVAQNKEIFSKEIFIQDADTLKQVITSYSIHYTKLYEWRASTENGVESIFEVQARGVSVAHGVQQYSQTQGARGTDGWGWGFNTPSQNLVDAFEAEGDDIRMNATIIFQGETLWDGRNRNNFVQHTLYEVIRKWKYGFWNYKGRRVCNKK